MLMLLKYFLLVLALLLFAAYAYNSLLAPTVRDSYDKIIFISSSYTHPYLLTPWRWYLQNHFPDADVEITSGYYGYADTPDERTALQEMKDQVVSRLESIQPGSRTAVISYSYGGVLLDAALAQLEQSGSAPQIARIVTIASPLAADDMFLDQDFIDSRTLVGYSNTPLDNHRAVCGRLDRLVSCSRAVYSSAQNPTKAWSNHYTFILPQIVAGRTVVQLLQD